MIHIQRPPEPEQWDGSWREELRKRATSFFAVPEGSRRQERFDWQGMPHKAILRPVLAEIFSNKCAYCESAMPASFGGLELHRPRQNAIGTDGEASPDHYWWLAWDWRNVLLACTNCVSGKGSRFPVSGRRAEPESGWGALAAELPLLLDPTVDRPEEHLRFDLMGSTEVAPLSERGAATIELLQLNRRSLVYQRQVAVGETRQALMELRGSQVVDEEVEEISRLLAADRPHCAPRRQVVAWALKEFDELRAILRESEAFQRLEPVLAAYGTEPGPSAQQAELGEPAPYSLSVPLVRVLGEKEPPAADRPSRAQPLPTQPPAGRYLRSISLHDFRGIEDLSLEFSFTTQPPEQAPWLMLLGENGFGKSSVLQAVALALMPAAERRKVVRDPRRLVRRGADPQKALVTLELSSGQAIELTIDGEKRRMLGTPPGVLLCAYGSTRLLPRGKHRPRETSDIVHAATLFDPFLPLIDAEAWLLSTASSERDRFDYAVAAIKAILDLANDVRFEPAQEGKEVEVHHAGPGPTSLTQLSDGYQAMLALTVDVIARASAAQKVVEAAEGLVLVDELGLHMHPRWKMRVVAGLRRAFPRLQFLCTTHDPLCLRGLYGGEVAVMRRDEEGRIVALTKNLPAVDALRIDQLLTSEYFGLQTAMDPEMETRFAEYYHLLGLVAPDAEQSARLAALKQELAGKELLGSSERERLMYEAIDGFLASKAALQTDRAREALPAMKQDLLVELQRIWLEA